LTVLLCRAGNTGGGNSRARTPLLNHATWTTVRHERPTSSSQLGSTTAPLRKATDFGSSLQSSRDDVPGVPYQVKLPGPAPFHSMRPVTTVYLTNVYSSGYAVQIHFLLYIPTQNVITYYLGYISKSYKFPINPYKSPGARGNVVG
jgi:hypothetical protein